MIALDLLRALAMLAVTAFLLEHHLPGALRDAASYGWLGTEPFFMISGFVIGAANWGRSPAAFLRGRAARLLPVLPLGLPALLVAPGNGTGMLRAELLFYALFTILLWRGLTRRRAVLFGYAWLIGAVLAMTDGPGPFLTAAQPQVAGFFVAGVAFALIRRFGPDIALSGLVAVAYVLSVHFTVARTPHHQILGGLAVTTFFAAIGAIAVKSPQHLKISAVGAVVYPFSLLAPSAGWLIAHVPAGLHPLLLVPAALLTVAVSGHLIAERPVAAYVRRRLAREDLLENAVRSG